VRKTAFLLEMGIKPNSDSLGEVRFGHCYSSGSVRVRVMMGLQLRIWFSHNCNCKKLHALKKSDTLWKNQTNHTAATYHW